MVVIVAEVADLAGADRGKVTGVEEQEYRRLGQHAMEAHDLAGVGREFEIGSGLVELQDVGHGVAPG
jgi:hypothetical protein